MLLPSVKYNLSHGFPDDWWTSKLEAQIIKKICSQEKFDLVVNATWGFLDCQHPLSKQKSDKFLTTLDLVKNHSVNKILFFNFVDPLYEHSKWYEILNKCAQRIGYKNIQTIGFIDTNKFKQDIAFQFWAVYNSLRFTKYTTEQILPTQLKNLFLCYNRKPTFHRKCLYDSLKKNNLLHKGIFSLGNEDPNAVIQINVDKTTMPFENKNMHGNLNIPNDTLSLGPLENWNSSFIIIVTETDHNTNTAVPFLSEKIWKPLIGMRPFVCLGDNGTIKTLKDAGFFTFNEFFGLDKNDLSVDDIVKLLQNYKGNLVEDYSKIKSKLEHNRKRFFVYAEEQKKIFDL